MRDSKATKKLTLAAVLTALILAIGFIPWLGYIKVPPVSITTLPIPVTIGSILLGWKYGVYFGFLFGITSFVQCYTGDALGAICVNSSIVLTFIMCVVTRMIMGGAVGAISDLFRKKFNGFTGKSNAKDSAFYITSGIIGPLLNTVLFVGALVLFFASNSKVVALFGGGIWTIITTLVTINSAIEIIACSIISTAVCTAVGKAGLLE